MKATAELAKRFREVMLNGTWIANTNYKQQLEGLDWQLAITSYGTLNSIALLVQHIHYYINGLNEVFAGGDLTIKDKYSFDFPPIRSQQEWESILARCWASDEAFASYIEQMPDEQLDSVFIDEKYGTYRRNIDGMIEHAYYHLGQVGLIKKLLSRPGQ